MIGEIHGAAVNTEIVELLSEKFGVKTILTELEKKWNRYLDRPGLELFKKNILKEKWLIESGLVSENHIFAYNKIILNGGKIIATRIENRNWNDSEKLTAQYVLNLLDYKYNNLPLITTYGNLHARNKSFMMILKKRKSEFVPLGYYLKDKAIFFRIRYAEGNAYNFGPKKLRDDKALELIKGNNTLIIKSRSRFFDYDILVKNTKSVTLIK